MTRDPRDTLNRVLHDAGLVERRRARRLLRRYESDPDGQAHAEDAANRARDCLDDEALVCPCGGEGPVCRIEIGDLMLDPSAPSRCRNCGHTQACHESAWRDRLTTR